MPAGGIELLARSVCILVAAVLATTAGSPSLLGQEAGTDLPDDVHEYLGPYAPFADSGQVAKLISEPGSKAGPRLADADRVLIARLWRRAGETHLAMRSLEAVDPEGDAIDLARYEVARVLFESEDNDIDAARAYWTACGSSDRRVREQIAWDLLAVTTPEEREAWPQLAAGAPTCEWLRAFWEQRAFRMAVSVDTRIGIHFRRLATARRDYYLAKPRREADMSSDHGRPRGLALDDRGLLYVRMGAPEYSQGCPEEYPVPPDSTFVNRLGVCWVYSRPPQYLIYYLTTRDRHGWNLPDNDYRIQETFGHQAEPGTLLFQRYVMHSDIPENVKTGLVRAGPVNRIEGLSRLGPRWEAALKQLRATGMDRVALRRYEREVELATRRYTAAAFEQIPDTPRLEATADLTFESLRFLNPSVRQWQVWMLGAVPAGHVAVSDERSDEDAPTGRTLDIAGRVAVLTPSGMRINEFPIQSLPSSVVPPHAGILLHGAVSAAPGPLPFTVVIEDTNAPGTGAWYQDTINVPSIGGLPQLSDIAVAQSEGGTWTRDGETFLQVTPAHITNPDGSIHTYFEVYGIDPDARYDVELRLAPTETAERVWRLEPDDLGFRLQFTSEMPGAIGRHHLRLDLGDTEPGEYVLAVRIQDEATEAYSLPSVTDVYVAERD